MSICIHDLIYTNNKLFLRKVKRALMKRNHFEFLKKIYINAANLIIILALSALFYLNWLERWNGMMDRDYEGKGNLLMGFVYVVMLAVFFKVWGGFKLGVSKLGNLLLEQAFALLCTNILVYIQMVLMVGQIDVLLELAVGTLRLAILEMLLVIFLEIIFVSLYKKLFPPYRMLQINGLHKNHLNRKMNERSDKYNICEEISVFETEETVFEKIRQYDAVLLNDIPSKYKNRILKYCFEHSVRVYFTPKISDIIVKGTEEINLFDSPLFLCKNLGLDMGQRFVKRCMDIVISLPGLILASPFILVAAICIKAYDRGPVFFRQERCTYQGRKFQIYKLRSMIVDAEKDGKPRLASDDDDRITPVGKFIRMTRIDELPQLFNVLKGDMSIVGPRPEREEYIQKYIEEMPEFSYRLKVKGGLTGYAQVYGKYNTTAYDKLKLDLIYIVNYSVLLDLQILLETLKVIFRKESTEGVKEQPTEQGQPLGNDRQQQGEEQV